MTNQKHTKIKTNNEDLLVSRYS